MDLHISQPQLAEALMRALDIKGDLPQTVAGVLDASVQVDDLTRPQYQYARRTFIGSAFGGAAAVAGQLSGVALGYATPVDPGVLLEVNGVIIQNVNAGTAAFLVGIVSSSLAGYASSVPAPMDSRWMNPTFQSAPGCTIRTGSAATTRAAQSMAVTLAANSTIYLPIEAVVSSRVARIAGEGGHIIVEGTALNSAVQASFFYRERAAVSSEVL